MDLLDILRRLGVEDRPKGDVPSWEEQARS